jgi:subtilase-type serine protease
MTTPAQSRPSRLLGSTSAVALLLAGAVIAGLPTAAQAGDKVWTGAVSNNWSNTGNWSLNGFGTSPPDAASGDNAIIDTTTPSDPVNITGGFPGSAVLVVVGDQSTGALQISGGGVLTASDVRIGNQPGSSGSVTVTGAGSKLITSDLEVAVSGSGTLTISSGGVVEEADGLLIAVTSGAIGTVTVDGANSSLTSHGLTIASAGGSNGTLVISNGGTVQSLGFATTLGNNIGSSGTVMVDGAGSSWTISSSTLEIGSSGIGLLKITNGGVVTADSAVVGNLAGSTGTLIVDGANSRFTTTGTSDDLTIGQQGTGTLTISNGGTVTAGSVDIASSSGSSGTLNIGAAPGSAPVAPGMLNTTSVAFDHGDGVINFNHTSANYAFDAAISGAGTINQIAGTTFLTADSSGFTGPTNISGGALHVNGSLSGSDVTVTSGGTLAGNGTVGSISAQSGGIVAPGNSIGTLNVAGNVVFASGSIYQVEVNAAGQGDKLSAGGAATISGGTVQVLAGAGNYAPSTQYTILTANGGVTGTFANVTSNLAFLAPSLSYDPNDVFLILTRNATSFASVGVTRNQTATGGGVDSLGVGSVVNNAVLNLSVPQAQAAFDKLSGEVHASAKTALIEDSRFVRDAAINRLRSAFGGAGASSGPYAAYAADGRPVAATTDGLAFWGQGFGSWGSTNGDGNAAKLSRATGGFLAGGDAFVFDGVRFGALAGYSRTSFDVKDRASSGSSDNYHFGLYGGTQWGALGFRTGAAYTWHQIDASRSVVFPGFSDQLSSRYDAGTAQVFGDLGYRIDAGLTSIGKLAFEPFANLAYVNLRTDGFNEAGGAAALSGHSGSTDVTFSTLGLRASTDFSLYGMATTARGSLGWRHAYGDVTPTALLAFAGGGSSFSIAGVPVGQDSVAVEAGFDVAVARNVSIGLSYVGQAASHAQDHDIKGTVNWKF